MRLIDADKLRINCFCVDRICVDGRTIENAPTVKAIPIEWIEKKCRELYEHLYLDESLGVQMLLRDWEKENEKSGNSD